jgi:hypothetical protein
MVAWSRQDELATDINIVRILEIQSRLQKHRGKAKLTEGTELENNMLQLFAKDDNWVTFVIKSLIQQAIKEDKAKIRFPKGETAAKIEGHATIADEIRKIDKELKNNRDFLENHTNLYEVTPFDSNYTDAMIEDGLENKLKKAEENIIKLEKQKQEYKNEGFEKLKPIEAFYEIKVGNILEKLIGKDNVKTITDEYGNQWRELDLTNPSIFNKFNNIQLQIDTNIKEGVTELFESNSELAEIGNTQQYSAYLDTIFPDSKVKDIVYHGTPYKFDKFKGISFFSDDIYEAGILGSQRFFHDILTKEQKEYLDSVQYNPGGAEAAFEGALFYVFGKGIKNEDYKDAYEYLKSEGILDKYKIYKIAVLINVENITKSSEPIHKDTLLKQTKNNEIIKGKDLMPSFGYKRNDTVYAVFEPEQIYILGSTKDIQGFKEYIEDISNNQNIVNNINDNNIKQELQDILNTNDIKLLDLALQGNSDYRLAFENSQNKLNPIKKINTIFNELKNYSENDNTFKCL